MQLQAKKALEYQPDPNKFDLRTHVWDAQGKLVSVNHYRLHIMDGISYYERPVNSGNLWFENNQPAGRMKLTFGKNGVLVSKELMPDEPHIAWEAPLEGDAALHYQLEQALAEADAAKAELAAIKAEQEKKFKEVHVATEGFPEQEAAAKPLAASMPAPPTLTKPKPKSGG